METATQKIPNACAAVIVFPLIVVITAKSMKLAWAVTSIGVGGVGGWGVGGEECVCGSGAVTGNIWTRRWC